MGKVNVYLPDDLEQEVRDAALSVSAICQKALRDALDQLAGVRAGDATRGRLTPRLAAIIEQAKAERAAMGRKLSGDDLLCFIMKHGENLGARALAMLGVDLPDPALQPASKAVKGKGEMDEAAQDLLVDAYRVAVDMRHEHVGTEHVAIAVAEHDGVHGQLLAALGVTPRNLRAQIEKLLANPWTSEREAPEENPELLARIEGELQRLAAEVDRIKGDDITR
jgi:ATP-dependent Clp protease ATP-binding subunit ClpC